MGASITAQLVCSTDYESWRQGRGVGLFSQGKQQRENEEHITEQARYLGHHKKIEPRNHGYR